MNAPSVPNFLTLPKFCSFAPPHIPSYARPHTHTAPWARCRSVGNALRIRCIFSLQSVSYCIVFTDRAAGIKLPATFHRSLSSSRRPRLARHSRLELLLPRIGVCNSPLPQTQLLEEGVSIAQRPSDSNTTQRTPYAPPLKREHVVDSKLVRAMQALTQCRINDSVKRSMSPSVTSHRLATTAGAPACTYSSTGPYGSYRPCGRRKPSNSITQRKKHQCPPVSGQLHASLPCRLSPLLHPIRSVVAQRWRRRKCRVPTNCSPALCPQYSTTPDVSSSEANSVSDGARPTNPCPHPWPFSSRGLSRAFADGVETSWHCVREVRARVSSP